MQTLESAVILELQCGVVCGKRQRVKKTAFVPSGGW
jgi:hypothetical protein